MEQTLNAPMLYSKMQIEKRIADEINITVIKKDSANAKKIIIIQEYSILLSRNSCIDSKLIIREAL